MYKRQGDDRNFQIAKNLDIFNAIFKELDMFYVDTIDPVSYTHLDVYKRQTSGSEACIPFHDRWIPA